MQQWIDRLCLDFMRRVPGKPLVGWVLGQLRLDGGLDFAEQVDDRLLKDLIAMTFVANGIGQFESKFGIESDRIGSDARFLFGFPKCRFQV